jgi:chromosome partitioning protein
MIQITFLISIMYFFFFKLVFASCISWIDCYIFEEPVKKPHETQTIAIVNQKGGVGKTTTAINISAALAQLKKKVLLIDLDPQSNATSGLGLSDGDKEKCIYNTLVENKSLDSVIVDTDFKNLRAAPATISLAGAEIELVSALSRETKLKRAIENLKENFDYIFIDCPPSLGLLTLNALTAANKVVIPVQCEYYALEGLSKLLDSIELVKTNLNPSLDVTGIVMTMHDPRTNLSQEVIDEVKKYLHNKVFKSIIPRNVRLSEAPSHGVPINAYDKRSSGAKAYRALAMEVMKNGK